MAQSNRKIVVHASNIYIDKEFEFLVSQNLSELDHNTYHSLKNGIASHFNLGKSRFNIYEDVFGQHKDIDDWDDLVDGLEQTDAVLHLHIKLPQNNDTEHHLNNITDEQKDDEKKLSDEPECDDLFKWMKTNGIEQYYDLFVDEYGIESLEDILGSEIDDLIEVSNEVNFTELEKQTFLNAVITDNNDNELKVWCNNINLEGIYSSLIENGYYSPKQLSALSKTERDNLCKKIKLKFGKKKRFTNAISSLNDNDNIIKPDRTIITVPSNDSNDAQANRTILFVGETGTGKTTTINSMMNYLYDAEFYGDRYQLITETFDDKKSTESQTSEVSIYYLSPTAIDFSLTIVDTPGFGNCDKKGIVFDQVISKQLELLFKTKVTEIDGICFVVKACESRLTQRQQYVFRQVIDIFGDNVANNIILLFTFDDGNDIPLGLKAVDDNNPRIPHRKNYFTFNNRPFKFDIDLRNKKNKEQFDENMEVFATFFGELTETKTQRLQLAAEVLEYRDSLKNIIKTVHLKLRDGLEIYQVIINRINEIEKNKDQINENDETLITIQVPESRRVIKKKKKFLQKINIFGDDEKKNVVKSMSDQECDNLRSFWVCEKCKLNCTWSNFFRWWQCPGCNAIREGEDDPYNREKIVNVKYRYQLVLKDVKVPVRMLDSGYLDSTVFQPRSDRLIAKETEQLREAEKDLCELIIKIKVCINKIKELALNKDLLSTNDYFDILIHEEKTRCTQGWENRVNALSVLKKQHQVIAKVEQNIERERIESIFPEFKQIKSFHEEQEKKENERIANMNQKSFIDVQNEKKRPKPNDYRTEKWWWFWRIKVFNLKYNDILQNFRGHIIAADTVDRTHLIDIKDASDCGILSETIYCNEYIKKINRKFDVFTPRNGTGTFKHCVRWMLLSPKDKSNNGKAYLVFKGTSELLEIIVNMAAIPHKLFANNVSEKIEVHGGMYGSLMREFEKISKKIEKLKIGQRDSIIQQFYITGHSLGGGLAILFGYEMIRRQLINEKTMEYCKFNVVTFGAPAVLAYDKEQKYQKNDDDQKKKKAQSICQFMKMDEKLQILNDITHCYINRLDPVPRLMHLLHSIPDIMPKIIRDIIEEKTTKLSALQGVLMKAADNPIQQLQQALSDLNPGELSSLYFCVGKQYIWCGKHKKYYCGEEMKIRARSDIVSSFDLAHIAKDIPLSIWKEMIADHAMANYNMRFKGRTTLI